MSQQVPYAELKHLLDTYYLRQVRPQCFGVSQQFASSVIKSMSNFADGRTIKSPDIYARHGGAVIGVEHFEYDCSKKTRRGSAERLGIERANREFLEVAYKAAKHGHDMFETYDIKTNSSVAALKGNFLDGFRRHQRQIDTYKLNLHNAFGANNAPIWFLAEDVSSMGLNFYTHLIIDSHPRIPLLPIFYKDVQEEILKSPIAGIIFVSSFPISQFVVFIANNSSSFDQIVQHYHFSEDLPIESHDDLPYGISSFCAW